MITHTSAELRVALLQALRECQRPLLLGHVQIDGDALGAAVAMAAAFTAHGCLPLVLLDEPAPRLFEFLVQGVPVRVISDDAAAREAVAHADLALVLDNNAWPRIGRMEAPLRAASFPVLCVDHHPAPVAFSKLHLVDTGAASTGVLVQEILEELNWPIQPQAADALYTALVNDTGWFRWSNSDERAFAAAQRLVRAGAQPQRVAAELGQRESLAGKQLLSQFLASIEVLHDGRCALGHVTQSMFRATGALRADSEDFVNQLRSIEGVGIAVFVREEPDGVKFSFRTRAPWSALRLAQHFCGGGHMLAAGASHPGPLRAAFAAVLAAVEHELRSTG